MLFNSMSFLLFFPLLLLVYFVIPKKLRCFWLLLGSYFFYMSSNLKYTLILVLSTVITYICGILIEKANLAGDCTNISEKQNTHTNKKLILLAGIAANVAILLFFKYLNFGTDIFNMIMTKMHLTYRVNRLELLMPIGISFYILQVIGYIADVYKGKLEAEKNIVKYALFVSFFPQIISGPIGRAGSLLPQFNQLKEKKLWDFQRISEGLILMIWGYFSKLVIADRSAILADQVFRDFYLYDSMALITGAVVFGIQIYCDFAGYSFIALGASKIMGIELINNFNAPYLSCNIFEFWRKWHVSLSSWLRDYIYIPLGGNRKGKSRKYLNILLTFAVSGLWHGANWTYLLWGTLHGVYQIIGYEAGTVVRKLNGKLHVKTETFGYKFFQVLGTFALVDFAWIFFKADSVTHAFSYIWRVFTRWDVWSLFDGTLYTLGLDVRELHILAAAVLLLVLVDVMRRKKGMELDVYLMTQYMGFRWLLVLFLFFFTVLFGCYGPEFDSAQFIYSQF